MTLSPLHSSISRRRFITAAGATVALAASTRLRAARVPASDRVVIGVIGWGMQGSNNRGCYETLEVDSMI
jgi:hypothetical protein